MDRPGNVTHAKDPITQMPEAEGKTTGRSAKITRKHYEKELFLLQVELVTMVEWIKHQGLKVVVVFEGRDAAGKGSVIKRITEHLSPRVCPVVALPAPTEREKTQWYFQRYVSHLPAAGEMVLFDRSWYNRAGVERVMGFCTEEEHREFLRSCPGVRTHAGAIRHPADQVLVLRFRQGAGTAVPEPHRGTPQTLETESNGPEIERTLDGILQGEGRDVRTHRHQAGTMVRRRRGRKETRAL